MFVVSVNCLFIFDCCCNIVDIFVLLVELEPVWIRSFSFMLDETDDLFSFPDIDVVVVVLVVTGVTLLVSGVIAVVAVAVGDVINVAVSVVGALAASDVGDMLTFGAIVLILAFEEGEGVVDSGDLTISEQADDIVVGFFIEGCGDLTAELLLLLLLLLSSMGCCTLMDVVDELSLPDSGDMISSCIKSC